MDIKAILLSKPALNVALMMSLKYFGIEPPTQPTRILYFVSIALHCVLLGLLFQYIRVGPEGKQFKAKEIDNENQKVLVRSYTWKSYDMQQTMQQGRAFALSVAITLAMHVWKGYKAPMLAACLQPIFMFIDPIFQTRVLGVDKVVERPVSDQFKKMQVQMMEQKQAAAAKEEKKGTKKLT